MSFRAIRFDYLVSCGCLLLLSYFAWHAWYGPRSHRYVSTLEAKVATLSADLMKLEGQKTALLEKVNLMRPESVDPDMLEELARSNLGWATANELIIKTTR
jgi:cell division protein FtsB